MFIDESVLQQQEGENDIFDKSLKDQMEAADNSTRNMNETALPYFDINQKDINKGVRMRKRRSYNP